MTISQFSDLTGLRPKLLRYYEETGLIVPAVRSENGYRLYEESQMGIAQLVNSLRQSDVSMAAIREFLLAPLERKEQLLGEWRSMAAAKLLSIQVANQFLLGINTQTKRVHLVHWECQKELVWFPLQTKTEDGNLQKAIKTTMYEKRQYLKKASERSGYVRIMEDGTGLMLPEIGFWADELDPIPNGVRMETMPQTLFATMVCGWDMPFSCKPILSMIRRFGFRQTGDPLRKVNLSTEDNYTLMIPVLSH